MIYELVLTGNKKIFINEKERNLLLETEKENKKSMTDSWITLGKSRFKISMIKGIFYQEEEVRANKDVWALENREWGDLCTRMSKKSLEEKVNLELDNRILPGLKLNKINLNDEQLAVMTANIGMFFKENPSYPRCPMSVWWDFIAATIAPINEKTKKRISSTARMTNWWKYIKRNDEAIQEWIRYR